VIAGRAVIKMCNENLIHILEEYTGYGEIRSHANGKFAFNGPVQH